MKTDTPTRKIRRYRAIEVLSVVRFRTRTTDGATLNPHEDQNHAEFEIRDAENPAFIEVIYRPNKFRPDHGQVYRRWVPMAQVRQLTPPEPGDPTPTE